MESMDPRLRMACEAGDLILLRQIVGSQVEILPGVVADNLCVLAGVTSDRDTALHIAVGEDHLDLARELCSLYPALVLAQNRGGDTPLHCAARLGSVTSAYMIPLLVEAVRWPTTGDFEGMQGVGRHLVSRRNGRGNTALQEAALEGHDTAAVKLLELDPELNSSPDSLQSLLYLAVEKKLVMLTGKLLHCSSVLIDTSILFNILSWVCNDAGGCARTWTEQSPPRVDSSAQTIDSNLLDAARLGCTDVLLHTQPRLLRGVTGRQSTILHIAAAHGHLDFVKQACKTDRWLIAARNSRGDTPLHCAARAGNPNVVLLLIEVSEKFAGPEFPEVRDLHKHAVLRASNDDGDTALHEAARNGYTDVAKMLVDAFPALSTIVNAKGMSPLYLAIERGSMDIAKLLLGTKDVSHAGRYGLTTLHIAVDRNKEITDMLLKNKPDLAISQDSHCSTPLHYVAAMGNVEITKLLLKSRASAAYMQDENGLAPIHMAAKMGHVHIIEALVNYCPDCGDLVDNKGRTFLHIAILKKQADVVKYTIHNKGLVHLLHIRDGDGNQPLHLAAMCDNERVVQLLSKDERVKKSGVNNQGYTPLDLALQTLKSISGLRSYRITKHLEAAGSHVSPYAGQIVTESYRNHQDEAQSQRALANNLALVAVLIATVSFAAAFTLPGGYDSSPGPQQGVALLSRKLAFKMFLIADTVAMVSSITVACILTYTAFQTPDDQPHLLQAAINIFWVALIGMVMAFGMAAYTVLDSSSSWLGILTVLMACSAPFFIWKLTSWGPHDAMFQIWEALGRWWKLPKS